MNIGETLILRDDKKGKPVRGERNRWMYNLIKAEVLDFRIFRRSIRQPPWYVEVEQVRLRKYHRESGEWFAFKTEWYDVKEVEAQIKRNKDA